ALAAVLSSLPAAHRSIHVVADFFTTSNWTEVFLHTTAQATIRHLIVTSQNGGSFALADALRCNIHELEVRGCHMTGNVGRWLSDHATLRKLTLDGVMTDVGLFAEAFQVRPSRLLSAAECRMT